MARVTFLALALTLTAGPLLAAPASLRAAPQLSAPADRSGSALGSAVKLLVSGVAIFGAIRIKDTGSLAQKFVSRAGAAAGDYKEGVQAGANDWEANTKAAEQAFEQGIQEALTDKRFGKGVSGSTEKYRKNATELGASRYGPGIANAKDAWASGVGPFLDKLKGLALPPRGPRRSPQNQQRSAIVSAELGKLATGK